MLSRNLADIDLHMHYGDRRRSCSDYVASREGHVSSREGQPLRSDRTNPSSVVGSVLVVAGALLFTCANTIAKKIMMAGVSQATMILGRGILAWTLNGLIAKAQGHEFMSVMCFRIRPRLRVAAVISGSLNGVSLFCLMIALDSYVDFGDAFGIAIGFLTLSTMMFSRLLGKSEYVTLAEVVGAAITIGGVIIISQPSWLFAAQEGRKPCDPFGVFLCFCCGLFGGHYNLGCRYLAQHGVKAAIVNSAGMWALGLLSLTIAACTAGLDQPPHWAQLDWPNGAPAWALLLAYCATITAAQLAFITSVQHLRASTAAILANAEIVFASIFGIFVLDQPTNGLAILGSLVIFAGCAVVAHGAVHGEANATASVTSEVEPLSDSSQRLNDEFEPPSEATMKRTGTKRGNGTRVRWLKIVRASRMGSR